MQPITAIPPRGELAGCEAHDVDIHKILTDRQPGANGAVNPAEL
jgi:hypothetical protein